MVLSCPSGQFAKLSYFVVIVQATDKLGKQWGFLIISAGMLFGYAGLVRVDLLHGTLRDSNTPQSIGWYLLAYLSYLAAIVWVEQRGISVRWLWGVAVVARLLLLFTTPTLSDDVYRMLWDGYIANQGESPYAYAIDAPELDYLEVPIRGLANNSWMASPYLPAAQGVFYGIAAVLPLQPVFLQGAMVIIDLFSAWIIAKLLALTLLPGRRLIIYLWNPLVIVEVAHGAHIDTWMIFLALLAVYMALKPAEDRASPHARIFTTLSKALSPFFLALGTLTKLLPALLLPVLFWLWSWPQRIFYGLAAVLLLLPFGLSAGWGLNGELDGTGLFGALRIYATQWNFNSGIFHWLEIWLGKQGVVDPVGTAKVITFLLLLWLVTTVWITARHRKKPRSALRLMSVPLMAYVLLTPTLHPWYLLFLLAFLPFLPPAKGEPGWRWLWAGPWLYLSGALVFSYLTYLNPSKFGELEWVRQLEWIPTILLLLITAGTFIVKEKREKKMVTI